MNLAVEETSEATTKINAYYRKFFSDEREEDEGSPYRQDDHVGQLGWGQE